MKEGDMAWFDAFYHQRPVIESGTSPSGYATPAIIVRLYTEKEQKEMFDPGEDYFKHGQLYDILVKGKVHIAPADTLIPMFREKEEV